MMAREKESYRDNLEALLTHFGGRHLLSASDVASYCGRDRRTVVKLFQIPKTGITAETLARRMS